MEGERIDYCAICYIALPHEFARLRGYGNHGRRNGVLVCCYVFVARLRLFPLKYIYVCGACPTRPTCRTVLPRMIQALRMRRAYVKCILKQDIGWFDEHPAGQLPTAVTANMAKVQDGLGRKVGDIVLNGLSGEW